MSGDSTTFLPESLESAITWAEQKKDAAIVSATQLYNEQYAEAAEVITSYAAEVESRYEAAKQTILSISDYDKASAIADTARRYAPVVEGAAASAWDATEYPRNFVRRNVWRPVAKMALGDGGAHAAEKAITGEGKEALVSAYNLAKEGHPLDAVDTIVEGAEAICQKVETAADKPLPPKPVKKVSAGEKQQVSADYEEGFVGPKVEMLAEDVDENDPTEREISSNEEAPEGTPFTSGGNEYNEEDVREMAAVDLSDESDFASKSEVTVGSAKASTDLSGVTEKEEIKETTTVAAADLSTKDGTSEDSSTDRSDVAVLDVQGDEVVGTKATTGEETDVNRSTGELDVETSDLTFAVLDLPVSGTSTVTQALGATTAGSEEARASVAASEKKAREASQAAIKGMRTAEQNAIDEKFVQKQVGDFGQASSQDLDRGAMVFLGSPLREGMALSAAEKLSKEKQERDAAEKSGLPGGPGIWISSAMVAGFKQSLSLEDGVLADLQTTAEEHSLNTVASKTDASAGNSDSDHRSTASIVLDAIDAVVKGEIEEQEISTEIPRLVNLGSLRRPVDTSVIC